MNRDEILAESAGERLNRWVAEQVMEWHLVDYDGSYAWKTYDDKSTGYDLYAWNPSERIEDAWEIMEKLKLTITPNNCHPTVKARWCVDIELKDKHDLWLVGAETAPLAICRAALLAITGNES